MNKLMLSVGAAALSLFIVTQAQAADVADVSTSDWSGYYVGAYAGWHAGDVDGDYVNGNNPMQGEKADELVGGLIAGANWELGGIVVGIEGDIGSGTGYEYTHQDIDHSSTFGAMEVDTGIVAGLRARIGLPMGENLLVYAAGGIAYQAGDVTSISTGGTLGFADYSIIAPSIGGGAEMRVGNAAIRLEALYNMWDESIEWVNENDSSDWAFDINQDITARVGVSYYFD